MYYSRVREDKRGALEGLPLYLIILVVITAVAIVAILSWMPSNVVLDQIVISGPETDGSILDTGTGPISITVYSTNGDLMENVVVLVEGPNNAVGTGTTNADGVITITLDTPPTLPPNTNTGKLDVEASYDGIVKTGTVIVKNA